MRSLNLLFSVRSRFDLVCNDNYKQPSQKAFNFSSSKNSNHMLVPIKYPKNNLFQHVRVCIINSQKNMNTKMKKKQRENRVEIKEEKE
jgi:hypothetical protein